MALAKVSFDSVKTFQCALSLQNPHTKRSRRASSRNVLNSQVDASRCNSAMYSPTFLLDFWCLQGK